MNLEKREWTILIYSNGNNDLAPEMHKSMITAQSLEHDKEVNVVMQISLASKHLVKIIRPYDELMSYGNSNKDTKRYLVQKDNSILLENLDKINMSNPINLYNFIIWGVKNYPANHYALVLGGHGYQFVGCMNDYSEKLPYIMGYVEMADAIERASVFLNFQIDFLFLDTCFANFIETIYEFGKNDFPHVKYILTNVINGPISGYPLDKLIKTIQTYKKENNIIFVLRKLIEKQSYYMVAFKIDHKKLEQIKMLFNQLAEQYSNDYESNDISLPRLFINDDTTKKYHKLTLPIEEITKEIIVCNNSTSKELHPLLNIANKSTNIKSICSQYQKLAFAKQNSWTKLVVDTALEYSNNSDSSSVVLSPQAVYAFICVMNSHADLVQRKTIFNNLALYKGWNIN